MNAQPPDTPKPSAPRAFAGSHPGPALLALSLLFVIAWSFNGVGLSPGAILSHWHHGLQEAKQFWPPDLQRQTVRKELWSTLQTVQIAVVGTLLGAVPAVPLSFLAARTTSFVRGLSSVIKVLMNILRATPIVIYAIILTAMIGLGAPTGAIAVAIGSFVMLTKLYAEALESVSPGPVEAVRAAGGDTAQTFVFGMLPQVFPNFVALTLYAFELNLQASFILGFVGAGGIGFDLLINLQQFFYPTVTTILIITVFVVNLVDFVSYRIRAALS